MRGFRENLILLIGVVWGSCAFVFAGDAQVLAGGSHVNATEESLHPIDGPIQLKKNSFDGLFACKDFLDEMSPQGLLGKRDLEAPGNGRPVPNGNTFSVHGDIPGYFRGERGFVVRDGHKVWYVDEPYYTWTKLVIPGHPKPVYLYQNGREYTAFADANGRTLSDSYNAKVREMPENESGLNGLRTGLATKARGTVQFLQYYMNALNNPTTRQPGSPDMEAAERLLARLRSADEVLKRLEACKEVISPYGYDLGNDIENFRQVKKRWDETAKVAVLVNKRAREREAAIDKVIAGFQAQEGKASAPVTPIVLKNDNLNDLFACNDLIDSLEGAPSDGPLDLQHAGNRKPKFRENSFSIHPDLLVDYNGKRGFFVRDGDKTYFVPRPKESIGVLTLGDAKPVVINASYISSQYHLNREEVQPYDGWDFHKYAFAPGLNPVELKKDDGQAIVALQGRLNAKFAYFAQRFRAYVGGPSTIEQVRGLESFRDYSRAVLSKQGSAANGLASLEACRMALAPNDQAVRSLLEEMRPRQADWNHRIELGREVVRLHREYGEDVRKLRDTYPPLP